jgi:hypothetical protein
VFSNWHIHNLLCLWIGLLNIYAFFGQTSVTQNEWQKGELVLTEGDTLVGEISFQLQNNMVQIQVDNTVKTFSARQVHHFQVRGAESYHLYYALPFAVESNYKVPVLFELLLEGPISLLCREKVVQESISVYDYYSRTNYYYPRTRIIQNFYFGFVNGNIKQYMGSKQDLFYLLKDHQSEVKKFIQESRLRYDNRNDLTDIISFYNSLQPNSR